MTLYLLILLFVLLYLVTPCHHFIQNCDCYDRCTVHVRRCLCQALSVSSFQTGACVPVDYRYAPQLHVQPCPNPPKRASACRQHRDQEFPSRLAAPVATAVATAAAHVTAMARTTNARTQSATHHVTNYQASVEIAALAAAQRRARADASANQVLSS